MSQPAPASPRPAPRRPLPHGPEQRRPAAPVPAVMRRGKMDIWLLAVTLVLAAFGLIMVLSASYYSAELSGSGGMSVLRQQLLGAGVGLVAMLALASFDYRILNKPVIIYGALAVSFITLGLVLIPGIGMKLNGSRRWLPLYIGNLTFQPSEMAKVALVMFNANFITKRQPYGYGFKTFMLPMLLVGGAMFGLVILQPNLSTAASILISVLCMLWMGGSKPQHLAALGGIAVVGVVVLIIVEPYRMQRAMAFVDPWSMSDNEGYQLVQSLLGIASGGIFGRGIGMSNQKYLYLPYAESDFIFAIIGEEIGFVGSVALLLVFFALIFLGMRVALNCPDRFGSLLAGGISSLFAVQVIINIAVVTGSMPPTGLPLPFFSAGGTSLSIVMACCGLLLSISRYAHRVKT